MSGQNTASGSTPNDTNTPRPEGASSISRSTIKRVIEVVAQSGNTPITVPPEASHGRDTTPWILQQFFNGEIDLEQELSQRYTSMPVMSTISFRDLGTHKQRGVATLVTGDGAAHAVITVDSTTAETQLNCTFGSMLTLHYALRNLSDLDRKRWLELMRRPEGGLAFLWGPSRWESDFLICVSRKLFSNIYAFSPNGFESALRITPSITRELLDWLARFWTKPVAADQEAPPTMMSW